MRSGYGWIGLGVAMSGLAACAAIDPARPTQLAGSAWQLLAIHSMDDAQGSTRVADPEAFTLAFGSDGRAVLRLDCNRGSAGWEAQAAPDGASGTLRFGPLASTRAHCAPPHLDERVVRDLPYVRGYLFKDGRLYLSLLADGGIYEWRAAAR